MTNSGTETRTDQSGGVGTCDVCGESAWTLLGGECISTCSEVVEYGDRLDGLVATMRGEADEIACRRPHRDAHLYDIEAGLRGRANDMEAFLQEEYYR